MEGMRTTALGGWHPCLRLGVPVFVTHIRVDSSGCWLTWALAGFLTGLGLESTLVRLSWHAVPASDKLQSSVAVDRLPGIQVEQSEPTKPTKPCSH